jgi:iron-sulfur cluster repair protein YtfE (RIC family)
MPAFDLNDVQELSPVELCNHLQRDFYRDIKGLLEAVNLCMSKVEEEGIQGNWQMVGLLFTKLDAETQQMIRYDEQIVFPLIRNGFSEKNYKEGQLPAQMMQQMTIRILNLLEKTRKLLNNYLPGSGWKDCLLDTCNNLFRLEQLLQQSIYYKENYLVPKVKERFSKLEQ